MSKGKDAITDAFNSASTSTKALDFSFKFVFSLLGTCQLSLQKTYFLSIVPGLILRFSFKFAFFLSNDLKLVLNFGFFLPSVCKSIITFFFSFLSILELFLEVPLTVSV